MEQMEHIDCDWDSQLHQACFTGNVSLANLMIDKGADDFLMDLYLLVRVGN